MHIYRLKAFRTGMTGITIGITEGSTRGYRLFVGSSDIPHEVAISIQLGLESTVETIVCMATVTFVSGYPIVFKMPGGKGHAFGVLHIVTMGFITWQQEHDWVVLL